MKVFSREELSQYTGREGIPAYIAYQGVVYDVSDSFLWKGGNHQALHQAGRDFTVDLDEAPHGPELLDRVPAIGKLKY